MIIRCPECELQVSDKAISCPHCGYPIQSNAKLRKPRNKNNKRRRLPNGFGQISEIKNRNLRNPFRAMVSVGKAETGRPICKPLKPESYFPTYNDAYAALVEYNKNPYDLEPSITVRDLYEKWSEEHFKTLKSDSGARAIATAWLYCSSVYNMRVLDVRARHIKGCMDEGVAVIKGKKQSPSSHTKNYIKSTFNQMLDYALEYELVDRNYSRSFSLSDEVMKDISTVQRGHIAFTDEEIKLLWDRVKDTPYVDALLIQCYSGWRPQEIGLLELENIDLENWTFKGGIKTEAGIDRVIPIHSRVRNLVIQRYNYARARSCKYLFSTINPTSHKEKKFSYDQYKRRFAKIREELNLNSEHRPHDGRTHFVTTAKKYGVDEYAIKYIVGHSISDITEKVYTKREFEWLRDEIEKIK